MAKKLYKTMQGKEIDLEAIRIQNEMSVAVGNGKMNARGDRLGPGGRIEKKIEEVVADYYENYPTPTPAPIPEEITSNSEKIVEQSKDSLANKPNIIPEVKKKV